MDFNGSPRDDPLAPGQELLAHDALDQGTLAHTLGAEDNDGGEFNVVGEVAHVENILDLGD